LYLIDRFDDSAVGVASTEASDVSVGLTVAFGVAIACAFAEAQADLRSMLCFGCHWLRFVASQRCIEAIGVLSHRDARSAPTSFVLSFAMENPKRFGIWLLRNPQSGGLGVETAEALFAGVSV